MDRQPSRLTRRAALFLAVFSVSLCTAGFLSWRQSRFGSARVTIGDDIAVRVDVARTPATWEQGLSGRERLDEGEGLLFIFPSESQYAFWMKDMLFPIDILWIKGGVLEDMTVDVPPPSSDGGELIRYFPIMPVDTVLEVPAGFAARHGLRTGMTVTVEVDSEEAVR